MPVFNVVQRRINKRGEGPLYVAFRVDSKKIEIPVKYSIAPGDFDKKKKRVKQSCPFHQDVNLIITNIIARANDIFVKYRLKNLDLTETAFWCEYRNPCDYTFPATTLSGTRRRNATPSQELFKDITVIQAYDQF